MSQLQELGIVSIAVAALLLLAAATRQQDAGGRKYWPTSIDSLSIGHTRHTHVSVRGVVAPRYPVLESDGDLHIKLVAPKTGAFIVAECIPELPCSWKPKAGDTVTVDGISRMDSEHGWWEVHPVERIRR